MEEEFYTCEFCQTKFIPKRRKAQKFCSHSCRSKNFHHKNKHVPVPQLKVNQTELLQEFDKLNSKKNSVDKMSLSGIGNAAAGTLAVEGLKAVANSFVQEKNKPATKGDIDEIKQMMNQRYLPIIDMQPNVWGQKPFYDIKTQTIQYLGQRQENDSLNII